MENRLTVDVYCPPSHEARLRNLLTKSWSPVLRWKWLDIGGEEDTDASDSSVPTRIVVVRADAEARCQLVVVGPDPDAGGKLHIGGVDGAGNGSFCDGSGSSDEGSSVGGIDGLGMMTQWCFVEEGDATAVVAADPTAGHTADVAGVAVASTPGTLLPVRRLVLEYSLEMARDAAAGSLDGFAFCGAPMRLRPATSAESAILLRDDPFVCMGEGRVEHVALPLASLPSSSPPPPPRQLQLQQERQQQQQQGQGQELEQEQKGQQPPGPLALPVAVWAPRGPYRLVDGSFLPDDDEGDTSDSSSCCSSSNGGSSGGSGGSGDGGALASRVAGTLHLTLRCTFAGGTGGGKAWEAARFGTTATLKLASSYPPLKLASSSPSSPS